MKLKQKLKLWWKKLSQIWTPKLNKKPKQKQKKIPPTLNQNKKMKPKKKLPKKKVNKKK